jgi:hypothetical protein
MCLLRAWVIIAVDWEWIFVAALNGEDFESDINDQWQSERLRVLNGNYTTL